MKRTALVAILFAALASCWMSSSVAQSSRPAPCQCGPGCQCPPGLCPDCPTRTLSAKDQLFGKISLGGQIAPDGKTEVAIDLPVDMRMRNIGSKIDGSGMCVTTASEHACRWHNLRDYYGFRDWAAQYPGGSYPPKHDKQIKQFAQAKGVPVPAFVQYEGQDPTIIMEALKAGLCVSCTYGGRDGVRYGGTISHFVNCVYLDRQTNLAAVMDNNGKAEDLIWMSFDEFVERWTNFGRAGWVFLWLVPPPPPPCCN